MKQADVEVGAVFFENLDVASVLDEVMSKCVVRLRRAREGLSRFNCDEVRSRHLTWRQLEVIWSSE